MKRPARAAEAQPLVAPVKRDRREGLPKSRRSFIAKFAPEIPREPRDTSPPQMIGQRKRKKVRRLKLHPPEA